MGGNQTLNIAIPHLDRFAYIGVFSSGIISGARGAAPPAATAAPAAASPEIGDVPPTRTELEVTPGSERRPAAATEVTMQAATAASRTRFIASECIAARREET
jgi:hypothetical protein